MASSLDSNVASCRSHVAPAERAGIVAATPAQVRFGARGSDSSCRLRLRFPDEVAHGRRGQVADDQMDVLRQHCHGGDAEPRPLRGGTDSGDDDRDVRFVDGELPPPRVPGDVRIQPGGCMPPPLLHEGSSHGWVHAGAAPRRSWSARPRSSGEHAPPQHEWANPGATGVGSPRGHAPAFLECHAPWLEFPYPHTSHPLQPESRSPKWSSSMRRRQRRRST